MSTLTQTSETSCCWITTSDKIDVKFENEICYDNNKLIHETFSTKIKETVKFGQLFTDIYYKYVFLRTKIFNTIDISDWFKQIKTHKLKFSFLSFIFSLPQYSATKYSSIFCHLNCFHLCMDGKYFEVAQVIVLSTLVVF